MAKRKSPAITELQERGRSPFDGRPYYCAACGAGFGEYVACEDGCELETEAAAEARGREPK